MSAQTQSGRKTVKDIAAAKGATPLVCLTAYTAPMAALLDEKADLLLVGDSVGMVVSATVVLNGVRSGVWSGSGYKKTHGHLARGFGVSKTITAFPVQCLAPSRNPSSIRLRTGCCSFRTALASICRTRSRVTLKIRPTSSRVYV